MFYVFKTVFFSKTKKRTPLINFIELGFCNKLRETCRWKKRDWEWPVNNNWPVSSPYKQRLFFVLKLLKQQEQQFEVLIKSL